MSEIKIAACNPIGSLKQFGYQYIWRETLALQAKVFDKVYLYVTTRENVNLDVQIDNVEVIVDDNVLFELDEHGNEIFDIYKIYSAYNRSRIRAAEDGVDFVFNMAINMYVNYDNAPKMRDFCNQLKIEKKPFGYAAKAFQLYDKICFPNTLNPMIINIELENRAKLEIDLIECDGIRNGWVGGHHKNYPFYITDVYGVETFEDLEDKFNWYVKGYMEQWQNKVVKYNKNLEIDKFTKKLGKIAINTDYKDSGEASTIFSNIKKDSLVRSIPFNPSSECFLIFKGWVMKVFRKVGILKLLGNR